MLTARLLTVSQHALPGGVHAQGECTSPGGYIRPGGVPARECTCQGGLPARGVPAQGGVPARGSTCPGTPPSCEQNDWQTGVKT